LKENGLHKASREQDPDQKLHQSSAGADDCSPPTPPPTQAAISGGSLLARNTFLNIVGQGAPLLVGVVTIPIMVRGLGVEQYGLFSLIWVILAYFTVFDLGLGRATTKYVAEALGSGQEEKVPPLVWTAVTVQLLFGSLGTLVLAGITPKLVTDILNVPVALQADAKTAFYLIALAIPLVMVSSSLSGVLEAAQRFELVNAVKVPSSLLTFILPVVGLMLHFRLVGIVALVLLSRVATFSALLLLNLRVFPNLRKPGVSFALFRRLFAYGGWIMAGSIVGPILLYLDRFMIASLLSVTVLTYYTAPYEGITRLVIIPWSLALTLFPAFSALGYGNQQRLEMLFARSIKYTLLVLVPIILIVELFAEEILKIALGLDFPFRSAAVLRILALGVLIASLAQVPHALLQGVGRPDLSTKFYLLELALYVGIAWALISRWGIVGAAAAWTLRVGLDTLLVYVATCKVCRISPLSLAATNRPVLTTLALLLLAGGAFGLKSLQGLHSLYIQSVLFITVATLSPWLIWKNVLDASDRGALAKLMKLS
jgi:O-antigen/teichoic acid export membrane protein